MLGSPTSRPHWGQQDYDINWLDRLGWRDAQRPDVTAVREVLPEGGQLAVPGTGQHRPERAAVAWT